MHPSLHQAAHLIHQADALVITAGAGMGVDSGLPDFRGTAGFWRAYPALAQAQLHFEDIASADTFARDPRLAWGFYGHRLQMYRNTRPHAGFEILQRWADRMPFGAHVFTSNVDGAFQRAGFAELDVHECHGSIHWLQCTEPCGSDIWPADDFEPEVDAAACRLLNVPPRCPHCGALARPNVLMFGDATWLPERTARQAQRTRTWLAQVQRLVVVELGAGTAIPSVRMFGEQLRHHHGARMVRINLREAQVKDAADVGLALGALEALQQLDKLLNRLDLADNN
jgi:NAD-dependent SIR2 family protein deacetylase